MGLHEVQSLAVQGCLAAVLDLICNVITHTNLKKTENLDLNKCCGSFICSFFEGAIFMMWLEFLQDKVQMPNKLIEAAIKVAGKFQ